MPSGPIESTGREFPNLAAPRILREEADSRRMRRSAIVGGALLMGVMVVAGAFSPTRLMPKVALLGCCVAAAFRGRGARDFAVSALLATVGFLATLVASDSLRIGFASLAALARRP